MKITNKKAVSVKSVGHFFKTLQLLYAKTPSPTLPRWEREQIRHSAEGSAFHFPLPSGEGLREGEKLNVVANHVCIMVYELKTLFTDIVNKNMEENCSWQSF
jgi:hypothetical protein